MKQRLQGKRKSGLSSLAQPSSTASAPTPWRAGTLVLIILFAYVAALMYERERVPSGMINDVAEEALRGLYLVDGHHFEVLTFSVGNSAETLYLYLVGISAHIFGPTTLAIQLVGWTFGLAVVWLVWKLVERIDSHIPAWVPLLTAACSLWLFHYARNGLRAISAPLFLAAFALLLDRAERRAAGWGPSLLAGAVLGLSLYSYTSARALPLAFLAYAACRLVRYKALRPELLRRYGVVLAGAFVASIPNLLFLLRHPKEFFARGDYVMTGSAADYAVHLFWSILFPLYYSDHYRQIRIDRYQSDEVAAGLTSAGHNPLPYIFAVALILGVWQGRRLLARPVAAFLVASWVVGTLTLGLAGPSPTRLLLLLPVYLVFVSIGFGWVCQKWPKLRIPVLVVILAVGAVDGYAYFSDSGQEPGRRRYYDPGPLAVGQRAEALASQGHRVMCIVSRDYNVVNYLTHRQSTNVKIVEFFSGPLDLSKIPFAEFRSDVLLIQGSDKFRGFVARFPAQWRAGSDGRYSEVNLPSR
jgi:hypothetical protein